MTMHDTPRQPAFTDNDLHALVDGCLSEPDRVKLEAALALDPQAQARVAQWRQQRLALRGLHAHVLDEAIPDNLLDAARQTTVARKTVDRWWRVGGVAASVLLSFGGGWLANTAWQLQHTGPLSAHVKPSTEFVLQARYAYSVYTPEVRHPVEVTAAEQAHLVQWLSKRVGKPLKVPNLTVQGFDLVGGRLLPGDTGARAQFMFQNSTGVRLTLYLGAIQPNTPGEATQEIAFRFIDDSAVPSFYWVDQGFGYALSAPLQRSALMELAEAVYRQL